MLKNDCDWNYIFRTAEEHRVVPLIFKSIKSGLDDLIPAEVITKFRSHHKQNAAANFARSTQLIKLVEQLHNNQVPVIAYKGMVLAEFAYRDITLRQFGDIDLFIRKRDFFKAKDALIQIECKPAWTLTEPQENAVLKYYYEYPFYFGETKTLIELHWEFVESFFNFDFEFEEIWNRTASVELYGRSFQTLSAEDYLIILSAHGSKHFWKRLSWICDIARLIENQAIDWEAVRRRASRYGSLRMVWIGAYLVNKILGTALPDQIREKMLADTTAVRLGKLLIENLFEEEKEPSEWTEMARIHLLMREKIRTKLQYSQRLFTTKLVDKLFLPMGRPR